MALSTPTVILAVRIMIPLIGVVCTTMKTSFQVPCAALAVADKEKYRDVQIQTSELSTKMMIPALVTKFHGVVGTTMKTSFQMRCAAFAVAETEKEKYRNVLIQTSELSTKMRIPAVLTKFHGVVCTTMKTSFQVRCAAFAVAEAKKQPKSNLPSSVLTQTTALPTPMVILAVGMMVTRTNATAIMTMTSPQVGCVALAAAETILTNYSQWMEVLEVSTLHHGI